MNELIYREGIFPSNKREELLTRVAASVSEYRYKHILGVEQAARKLALRFNEDEELASIAALVHDYAKERSDADFKQVIMANGLDQDLLNWNNFIWHYFLFKRRLHCSNRIIKLCILMTTHIC